MKNNIYQTEYFDYVFVCNGHYTLPYVPEINGKETFVGKQIHSHNYRKPDTFEGDNVLLIGGGPSGKDIVYALATKAKHVYFSTHRDVSKNIFPINVTVKPDVQQIKNSSVVFGDDSENAIDVILYCTGN